MRVKLGKSKGLEDGDEIRWRWDAQPWGGKRREGGLSPGRNGKSYSSFLHLHEFDCYALSPYLRTDREREQVHHGNARARREFISSALGPKSHPTQGNPTRAPNKGVWRLIYRQFFVSVTGVAGVT